MFLYFWFYLYFLYNYFISWFFGHENDAFQRNFFFFFFILNRRFTLIFYYKYNLHLTQLKNFNDSFFFHLKVNLLFCQYIKTFLFQSNSLIKFFSFFSSFLSRTGSFMLIYLFIIYLYVQLGKTMTRR